MHKDAVTIAIMSDGYKFEVHGTPSEIAERMTDEEGKLRDEFIAFGAFYINPKQVTMLYSGELERK